APAKVRISSTIALRSGRTRSSLPSGKHARYVGSRSRSVRWSSRSAPAAAKVCSSNPTIVRTVGPESIRKPASSTTPARPPGPDSRSTTTTSWPRPARWHAADSPPRPAPTTTVRTRGSRLAVAPGHERTELLERDTRVGSDRRHGERLEGLFDEPRDTALDFVDRARVDEHGLQAGDLGVVEVGAA